MPPEGAGWIRRLFGYCWRHPVITLLAGLSAVGGVGLGALTPLLTQVAVDDATAGSTDNLGWVIAGLVALALIRFGSSFLRRWAGGRLSLDVQHDMRQDVFGALQRLDGSGQDRLRTGQVVSRASTDLQMVQGLLAMVPLSAGQVVLFVVSLAIMVTLSPLLTVIALLVIPAVVAGDQGDPDGAVPGHLGGAAVRGRGGRRSSRRTSPASGWSRASARRTGRLGRLRDGARRLFAEPDAGGPADRRDRARAAGADRPRPGRRAGARRLPRPDRRSSRSAPSWRSPCTSRSWSPRPGC